MSASSDGSPAAKAPLRLAGRGGRLLRAVLRLLILAIGCTVATLVLFEIIYRTQAIDTYKPELKAYNDARSLSGADHRPGILILGDSFTAGHDAYPALLQSELSEYRVINAGITATGILEASIVAPGRLRRFTPSVFIYQIYVGNDLFNIRYDLHWGKVSAVRNLYWLIAQRLRGLGFLNYRAGQVVAGWRARNGAPPPAPIVESGPFDPARYDGHERSYLEADPSFLEDQILLQGARKDDFQVLLGKLGGLLAMCREPACRSYVLVIPHACQVDQRYLENMVTLGGQFQNAQRVSDPEYPFLLGIRALLKEQGLGEDRLLDPLPALRASEEAGEPAYFLHDPHLNSRGQRILAEMIRSRIAAEKNQPL